MLKEVCSVAASVILFILAALHWYWFFGGKKGLLVVVPTNSKNVPLFSPSPLSTLTVASLLTFLGILLLLRIGFVLSSPFKKLSFWIVAVAAVAFLARAVGEFKYLGFFKKQRGSEFAKWDSWLFSPLCCVLACLLFLALGL
ncbi:DUF3995 domain-containing protein [Peredibacter sp. HCB2-198]|uniref:DUF3995 domain-containing protein n=1 Tax=Peredibacter sp. HCB2-198 TaxID=3383025 RepID=UPI0038B4D53B